MPHTSQRHAAWQMCFEHGHNCFKSSLRLSRAKVFHRAPCWVPGVALKVTFLSLRTSLMSVSATRLPAVTWMSTTLAPPLQISAKYPASLCCPPVTLCLRCLAESNRRAGAGERPVFDATLTPLSASVTPSGGLIQTLLPSVVSNPHITTRHFLFVYIWEQSSGFPGSPRGKEPVCQCRRQKRLGFNPWVGKATRVQSLGGEDPLEEGMATHPRMIAWRIAWTEEPGGLHPQGHTESDTPEATQHACEQSFLFSFTPAQDTHSACHNSILTVQSDSLKAPYYFHKFSLLGGSL